MLKSSHRQRQLALRINSCYRRAYSLTAVDLQLTRRQSLFTLYADNMLRRLTRVVTMGPGSEHELDKGHKKGTVRVNTGKRTETLTEEQLRQRLRKHELVIARREKEHELQYMKTKLSHHRLVLHILNESYYDTAGQCPCCRYYDMRICVEECIDNYHDKNIEIKYMQGNNPLMEVMGEIDNVVTSVKKMSAATNALNMFKMGEDELIDNMMTMEEELNTIQRQVMSEERKINKLTNRFHKLHETNMFMRYNALKEMIEEACMDCVTDERLK